MVHMLRLCVVIAMASCFFFTVVERTHAHKPVTSKYDYNRDVFPLLRDHCSRCHVEGGPAPMSLMTYTDAAPWAASIRDEVTAGRMPPWPVDVTSPAVKGDRSISSHDLNIITVWASGGTPQGDPDAKLPAIAFARQWKLGTPDLEIPMPAEHVVAPGTIEETVDVSLAPNVTSTKWIKAADLMPGTASVVRDAIISIENGPVLALWEPGVDTSSAPNDAAFQLAPGSKIHLQIHYKKHFDQEQNAVSDKSMIGLYLTDPPGSGRELRWLTLNPGKSDTPAGSTTFAGALGAGARIVALRPMLDRAYESVSIDAITASGTHVPLLRLRGPRPQWFQRYWLEKPVELPGGTQISVSATPLADYSDEPKTSRRFGFEIAIDYVPLS
jgi:hypothetical protein